MEKEELVRSYMGQGMKRDHCLEIVGLSKNQLYYKLKGNKPGRAVSMTTIWRDPTTLIRYQVDNQEVVEKIVDIKLNPDHTNWYRMIAVTLAIRGYYINHKKVYRLMQAYVLLEPPRKRTGRDFVQYRQIVPEGPLRVIEMDIKQLWIHGTRKRAYVLTVIDTYTRYVLHWDYGYHMTSKQVEIVWQYIIAEYFQPMGMHPEDVKIEVRSDNGKQFNCDLMTEFFKSNQIDHVFTHPYTPEENGHIESFHDILSSALKRDRFNDLDDLKKRLIRFYECYNNDRSHSGTHGIPPAKFWALHDLNKIEIIPLDKNKAKIQLQVAYQDILTLPGIFKYHYRANRA